MTLFDQRVPHEMGERRTDARPVLRLVQFTPISKLVNNIRNEGAGADRRENTMIDNRKRPDDYERVRLTVPAYVLAHLPDLRLAEGRIVCSETSEFTLVGDAEHRSLMVFTEVAHAQKAIVSLNLTGLATYVEINHPRELKAIAFDMIGRHPGTPIGAEIDGAWVVDYDMLDRIAGVEPK